MFRKRLKRGRMATKKAKKKKEGEKIYERLHDKGDDSRRTGDGA